jgi:hypothetical protein
MRCLVLVGRIPKWSYQLVSERRSSGRATLLACEQLIRLERQRRPIRVIGAVS